MDRPLRLIPTEVTPAAELARTLEALLVVASQPLPVADLSAAAGVEDAQIEEGLELLESLAALPRVDDLGDDVAQIRERLEAVAEKRPA